MNAIDERTFGKYYNRVKERLAQWLLVLTQWSIGLNTSVDWEKKPAALTATITKRWHYFKYLSEQYIYEIEKLPDTNTINDEDKLLYILALLSQNHLGLGP